MVVPPTVARTRICRPLDRDARGFKSGGRSQDTRESQRFSHRSSPPLVSNIRRRREEGGDEGILHSSRSYPIYRRGISSLAIPPATFGGRKKESIEKSFFFFRAFAGPSLIDGRILLPSADANRRRKWTLFFLREESPPRRPLSPLPILTTKSSISGKQVFPLPLFPRRPPRAERGREIPDNFLFISNMCVCVCVCGQKGVVEETKTKQPLSLKGGKNPFAPSPLPIR